MGIIGDLLGGGIFDFVTGIIGRKPTPEEKLKLQELIQQRDSEIEATIRAEMDAKTRILEAELSQGDTFTKRARPSVVYFGLFAIFYNYCFVPTLLVVAKAFGQPVDIAPFDLPGGFWAGWTGIVTTWVIGRSAEKRGARSQLVQTITGNGSLNGN